MGKENQTFLVVYVRIRFGCVQHKTHVKSSLIIQSFIVSQTKSRNLLSRAGSAALQLLATLAMSSFECHSHFVFVFQIALPFSQS